MKTNYKYIMMEKLEQKQKTSVWGVKNNHGDYFIGSIRWNPGWRQYCFFPDNEIVFSVGCLKDICEFIVELRKEEQCGGEAE
jgi:hypothetical protein